MAAGMLVAVGVPFVAGQTASLSLTVNELSSPWATDFDARSTRLLVKSTLPEQLTVRVWHDGSNVLTFRNVDDGEELELWISREHSDGDWYATAATSSRNASVAIPVAHKWALLGSHDGLPSPCSAVPWFLDSTGGPGGMDSLPRDIANVLGELSEASGLTFPRTSHRNEALLVYSWEPLGPFGNPGLGGFQHLDNTFRGWVTLNSDVAGIGRHPSARPGSSSELQALILHETAHALGLGHVVDPAQVMHPRPTTLGPTSLGDGDRAGLAWLYRPDICA